MDRYEGAEGTQDPAKSKKREINIPFLIVIILVEVFSCAIILMMIWWVETWRGGFGWSSTTSAIILNYHPVFMSIGFFFLYTNGVLFYRVCEGGNRVVVRSLHGIILFISLAFAWIAFISVWRYHEMKYAAALTAAAANNTSVTTRYHLTSIHSWAGFSALLLFSLQWLLGLFNFIVSLMKMRSLGKVRAVLNFAHRLLGPWFMIWVTAIALTGIMELGTWSSLFDTLTFQTVLVNVIGFFILALGPLVYFALQCKEFKCGLFQLPCDEGKCGEARSGERQELLRREGPGGQQLGPLVSDDEEDEQGQLLAPTKRN